MIPSRVPAIFACLIMAYLVRPCRAAEPLTEFQGCKYIATPWADGDSFEIRMPDGIQRPVRLYGADCIEWHVNDESDARRLREQRRYFGIAEFGDTPQASMDAAKEYMENLRDVELVAAKTGAGAWEKTNWDKLSGERQLQRSEDAELEMATSSAKSTEPFQLDPNTAARDELMKIPGVGEKNVNRIIQARPSRSLKDLLNVEGIGPATLEKLTPYLKLQDRN